MRIRPTYNHVLILPDPITELTEGGVVIPVVAQSATQYGTVIATGLGKPTFIDDDFWLIPTSVSPGDKVIFARWSGDEVHLDGIRHLMMRETDLLAVIGN